MQHPVDKRLITVEEYHKMAEVGILTEKRIELIEGEIIKMSPIGSKHAAYVNHLNRLLSSMLSGSYLLSIQNPVQLGSLSEPEPDLAILHARKHKYFNQLPRQEDVKVVIEVANSSLSYEQQKKTQLYADAGIEEYYILNIDMEIVEAYSQPRPGKYNQVRQIKKGNDWAIPAVALTLPSDSLWLS